MTAEDVHFHEVGAVDAIIDIVGACTALDQLAVDEIVCSSLPMGSGTVDCAHGTMPLPAPAVAAMLPGVPVHPAGVEGETVTPTGAALVTTFSNTFGPMPAMTVETVGIGGGTMERPGLPNVLRAFVGEHRASPPRSVKTDHVVVECNVDDLDPRVLPVVIDRLSNRARSMPSVTPIVMKKGRPGHLITALAPDGGAGTRWSRSCCARPLSLGCRSFPVTKHHLGRRMETVETPWGPVAVKLALAGDTVLRRIPEFEDCAELARATGVPVRDILAAAGGVVEDTDG